MANSTAQVSVTTTAASLVTAPASSGPAASTYTFQNAGATDCYLGTSNAVTASTGFLLKAGAAFSCDLAPGDKMFAVTGSGSTSVHVFGEVPS